MSRKEWTLRLSDISSGFGFLASFILRLISYVLNMLNDTISKIEAKLQNSSSITGEQRTELLHLLSTLKKEVAALSRTHDEQAQSIAGFAELSTHEATREEKNPELLKLSVQGLSSSVDGFEKSHPQLVALVNRICTALSNMGI